MPTPKKAASAKSALSKPVQPDAALAAVVGKDPLPRTELTKKLWEYIRKHELQDPKDKRNVRADETSSPKDRSAFALLPAPGYQVRRKSSLLIAYRIVW